MEILLFLFFWITNVSGPLTFIIGTVVLCVTLFGGMLSSKLRDFTLYKQYVPKLWFVFLFILIPLANLPTLKQMAMVFGIPATIEIMQNPKIQMIPSKILDIIINELDESMTKKQENKET